MMIVVINFFFTELIILISEIPFNKFEKEKRVIEMHLAGKTIRDTAKEPPYSHLPLIISKIIKSI